MLETYFDQICLFRPNHLTGSDRLSVAELKTLHGEIRIFSASSFGYNREEIWIRECDSVLHLVVLKDRHRFRNSSFSVLVLELLIHGGVAKSSYLNGDSVVIQIFVFSVVQEAEEI